MKFLKYVFSPDYVKYEGVRPVNIYLLRFIYFLMVAFMSVDAWKMIFTHDDQIEKFQAVAICVWAAYGTLSFFGLLKPLKWLPIVLFMIFYKTLWLVVFAFPLWRTDSLAGSSFEEMTYIFLAGPLFAFFVPWKYVLKNLLIKSK